MSSRWRDFRGVGRPVGAVMIGLAVACALCAVASLGFRAFEVESRGFAGEIAVGLASLTTALCGIVVYWYGSRHVSVSLTRREAILAVVLIWGAAGVFGAIPFVYGAGMSLPDAVFETVSGFTTTGATVVTDIEGSLPKALLLWRSLIQWLGGMGIVVLFVAIFPSIGASGKHMFGEEVPGAITEGLKPRIAETSRVLWKLYAAFTIFEVGVLYVLGMSGFEALCHAFTTMSTGGFSTRDASVAAFDSAPIEFAIGGFMLIGSVNYNLYYGAIRGRTLQAILRSVEFRVFCAVVALCILVLTAGLTELHGSFFKAFRYAFFMVATTVSSTGYGTDAYMAYPSPMLAVVVAMMFMGGCSGSTAGGMKVERLVVLAKGAWVEFRRSFRPNLVDVVRLGRSVVPSNAITNVATFFTIYIASLGFGVVVLAVLEGISLPTAFGAMLTCLSNMGPAPFHVGADNFAGYTASSKMFCALMMVLGRLEFFAFLALLVPEFWRR